MLNDIHILPTLLHAAILRGPSTPAMALRVKRLNARINEAIKLGVIRVGHDGYHYLDTDGRWHFGGPSVAGAYECLRMDRAMVAMAIRAPRLAALDKQRRHPDN